jgi:tetratricopeptide (TPR) repeat protein
MSAWRLHSQAAELYRRTGDEQRAETQMRLAEQAIGRLEAFHPTNVFALQTRLDHLLGTGQTEQVLELATRSSRVLPGSQLELYAVHALASTGNYERALELARRFRAGPGKDHPWMQLAHLLTAVEHTNAWAEAVALVAEVSSKGPDTLEDWLMTTRMNLLMGRSGHARQIAQDFLKNQSRRLGLKTRAFEIRAVRLLAGEIPEEDWLEEAKGRGWPALVYAHHLVALRHLARGDRDSARSHLRHACNAALVPGRTVLLSTYLLKRLTEDTNWPPTIPKMITSPTL